MGDFGKEKDPRVETLTRVSGGLVGLGALPPQGLREDVPSVVVRITETEAC